jgi:spore coat protein CotH
MNSLYNIINSGSRIINHNSWKSALEEVFDVPAFLRWLAANTVMQDWDTYGLKHHNYYLYNNPATLKLTWIPWDNNESLSPGGEKAALSLALDKVSEGWPLIRYIVDDPDYMAAYKSNVSSFIQSPFSVSSFSARIDNQADLIKNYVLNEVHGYTFLSSYAQFEQAVLDLKQHVQNRADSVAVFLAK